MKNNIGTAGIATIITTNITPSASNILNLYFFKLTLMNMPSLTDKYPSNRTNAPDKRLHNTINPKSSAMLAF